MSSIYLHNSRCSKSRQGLDLINKKGIKITVREYLKDPLNKTSLKELYSLLIKNYSISEFTRIKEKTFKELQTSIDNYSSKDKWVKLISENPILLERPILFSKTKAIIGRPPEKLID